ncbi:MAG: DUF937 domain-containing protein [Pseudomonadota bacterium]
MSLLNLLTQAQGGQGLGQLAQQLGLDQNTAQQLAGEMAPAMAGGMRRRAKSEGGMAALLGQLQGERQAQYYDDAPAAIGPDAMRQGEDFMAQIFGGREAAPQIAQRAAERVGAPVDKAQQMMPALAAMLQGGMQRQAPDNDISSLLSGLQGSGADRAGAGIGDILGALGQSQGGGGGLGGVLGALSGGSSGGGGGLGGMLGALTGGGGQAQAPQQVGLGSLLQMLDADGDGSPMDEIVGMLMK